MKIRLQQWLLVVWCVLLGMPTVQAQLGTPQLPNHLPNPLPGTESALGRVGARVERLTNEATAEASNALANLRRTQIRTLLKQHPDLIEADPRGAPMVRHQVVGVISAEADLAAILAAGFVLLEDERMQAMDLRMITLWVPARMTTAAALQALRTLDPAGTYDFNHLYMQSGTTASAAPDKTSIPAYQDNTGPARGRIGLIDGGVAIMHPAFKGAELHVWGCDGKRIASEHGTAVASIMIGRDGHFHGAIPGATLYAADVYCGQPTGGAISAVLSACAWLAQQQVPVINISLVGPANLLLEAAVKKLSARGVLIVAAVGNDGPAAPPLYPASYPDVIGVTAVDARNRVLPEAAHGKQVAYAAPGADMAAASSTQPYVSVRGTSFAAPVVAGLLAQNLTKSDRDTAEAAVAALDKLAMDLGARGTDQTYGKGLVGTAVRVLPAELSADAK